jgi:predicted dehydrogenase
MPSSATRVAVVGVGHLGKIHARILAENPLAELVCVVDADGERAASVAAEHGCRAVSTPAELPDDLEAAIVAVPTVLHAEVAVPLLERGVAVLVEKPLAASTREGETILAAAQRGKALLTVGHVERFQPGVRKVRELGMRARFVECHRLAPFGFRSLDVGVVHDLMIHDLDLVLDFVGSEVEAIDAAGGAILTQREDVASVRLIFANGARANVTASRASLKPLRRLRIFSGEGYVSLDFSENYGLLVKKGPKWEEGRAALARLDPTKLGAAAGDWMKSGILEIEELDLGGERRPLQAEVDAFLHAVRDGAPPEVTGEDGLRALALAERIATAIRAQEGLW